MRKKFSRIFIIFSMCLSMLILPYSVNADEVKEFDFDTWHKEAMQAYEEYTSLLYSKTEDSTWDKAFTDAEITRMSIKKTYLESVKNATEEEWDSLPPAEIIDYTTTYLKFVLLIERDKAYYDSCFNSGEVAKMNYFNHTVGISVWRGNGCEELKEAYMKVADYQLAYYEYYNFPYNFHDDMSYAEATGLEIANDKTEEINLENEGLNKDEISEIESAIKEETTNDSKALNPLFIIIPIVFILVGGVAVILVKKNKTTK